MAAVLWTLDDGPDNSELREADYMVCQRRCLKLHQIHRQTIVSLLLATSNQSN